MESLHRDFQSGVCKVFLKGVEIREEEIALH